MILIISLVAGMATYVIANTLKKGAVIASAIITLLSGLILPYIFPIIGGTLATVAACASYAGMISLKNAPNLREMAIISLITGMVFIAARSAYSGIGGKLGTMAAISCFAWLGIKKILVRVNQ